MRQIDGGAGGGQLLRWAVALSALRGEAIEIESIRGARDPPGLRPQHLAAVRAAAAFTDAEVSGLEEGSETLEFDPGPVTGGITAVDVGTAGSIPLVFDTVLPLALQARAPIQLTVTGGTDVKWSPPIDYLRYVKAPVLADFGLQMSLDVERRGFYPSGGGRATLTLQPSDLRPIERTDRGPLAGFEVYSVATADLGDAEVAERQAETAALELDPLAPAPVETSVEYVEAASAGSSLVLVTRYEQSRAGFTTLGERGKPSEVVARETISSFEAFDAASGAIDTHLVDQLLPFLAVAGGHVTTPARTDHLETAVELVRDFGYTVTVVETEDLVDVTAPGR